MYDDVGVDDGCGAVEETDEEGCRGEGKLRVGAGECEGVEGGGGESSRGRKAKRGFCFSGCAVLDGGGGYLQS